MKTFLLCTIASTMLLCGCHENLEKRAAREAREYTEKYCPTPVQNYMRTDSVVFDVPSRTYHYYCSIMNELDDSVVFEANRAKFAESFIQTVNESTSLRAYKKEGFNFAWTLRSGKDPKKIWMEKTIREKEYAQNQE